MKIADPSSTCSTLILSGCVYSDDCGTYEEIKEYFFEGLKRDIDSSENPNNTYAVWSLYGPDHKLNEQILQNYPVSAHAFLYGTVLIEDEGEEYSYEKFWQFLEEELHGVRSNPQHNTKNDTTVIGYIIPVDRALASMSKYFKATKAK